MPEIEEIVAIEKTLHPEIEFVGYVDEGDELIWDFNYVYRPFVCNLKFRVRITTDRKGKVLKVSELGGK